MKYLYKTEKTLHGPARVAVSIPVTRPRVLARALAGLLAQTYTDFDVWLVYDKQPVVAEETAQLLRILSVGHNVHESLGTGEGQVHVHNHVLWNTQSEFCLRLDDDVILDKTALASMVDFLDTNSDVGAVSGLWFAGGVSRKRLKSVDEIDANKSIKNPNAGLQMNYHFSKDTVDVEHLYSVSLYRAEPMRIAGGWPTCYTKNLHHREETDGTNRLFNHGWRLVVLPHVTGVHLWAAGGVREDPDIQKQYGEKRKVDDLTFFIKRLPTFPELSRKKKVVVYSEHTAYAAGGERHFYATLAALSARDDLEVWGGDVGQGYLDADRVREIFGFDISRVRGFKRRWEFTQADRIDLAVSVSHSIVPRFPAAKYMGFILFPMEQQRLHMFDRLYANSSYTKYFTKQMWNRTSGVIYPPPNSFTYRPEKKQNRILIIGWYGTQKGQWEAIQAFRQAQLPNWKLTSVGWPGTGEQMYYRSLLLATGDDPNIELLSEVGRDELKEIVESSRIILGMRGLRDSDPRWQEHFGLSVPEAMSAGVVPLLYKSGGYLEVYPRYTFKTLRELAFAMKSLINWGPVQWNLEAEMAVERARDFCYERYARETVAAVYEVLRSGADSNTPYVVGQTASNPDIAVVIPNYKHEDMLWESVGSALASTYRDFEVVVVDDESPEGSKTAAMYRSDKVKIIKHHHAGPSIARNAGIDSSKAQFIFPLDADDFILPDALRQLRKENDGEIITYGDCIVLRNNGEALQTGLPRYDFKTLLEKDIIPQSALFPRWAWYVSDGYKKMDGYEDWEFWISLGESGCAGRKLDIVTHVYRESASSGRHLDASNVSAALREEIRDIHKASYGRPVVGCCAKREREECPEWLCASDPKQSAATRTDTPAIPEDIDRNMIYSGLDTAPFNIRGNVSRQTYRVRRGTPFLVRHEDVDFISSVPGFGVQ